MMKSLPIAICLFALNAQSYTPRLNFGARLEPQGLLMHGAGQSRDAFSAYWNAMPVGGQPMVYMYYISLKGLAPNWADALKTQLLAYPNVFLIPQIGLSMTDGVGANYEQQVANGDYDAQITNLITGLQSLATPVYLRIGYEFNGLSWNGYQPDSYKQAFTHITDMVRAQNLEVATVWDAEIDGVKNLFDYYPGDDYVDWFGMNIFSAGTFNDPSLPDYFAQARAHMKPVMIGETTPRYVGAQNGPNSWTGWYNPFFNFLQSNPEVKQFNYIDWDWAYWAQQLSQPWSDWGDARLETDAATYVRNMYIGQLADPAVLHATSESTFRQTLGFNDTTAPDVITDLSVAPAPGGAQLTWTPAQDESGIARYYIYRNDALLDYTLSPPYIDSTAPPGSYTYNVAVMDRAGNLSALAPDTAVALNTIERLTNGDFESGLTGWEIDSFNSQAIGTATADFDNPVDGSVSARLDVAQSSGTNWHLQLRRFFTMTAGLTYTVSFQARAGAPTTLPLVIQQVGGSNTIYLTVNAAVGTGVGSYQGTFIAPATQKVAAAFFFGNIGTGPVWVDDVSVQESNPMQMVRAAKSK